MTDAATDWFARVEAQGRRILARRLAPYGLTIEDYEALMLAQMDACAGCEKTFTAARPACVDHDHRTGQVRGLLCSGCNQLLGFLHNDGDKLRRLSNHLLTPIADRVFDKPRRHVDAPPERYDS